MGTTTRTKSQTGSAISELQAVTQRLKALISSSFDAIIAISPERKIILVNRQAELLLGWSEAELTGDKVIRLHADLDKARQIYNRIEERGRIDREEVVLIHKDGSRIPVTLSGKVLTDEKGKKLGQVGFMRDLREIQQLETRLKALLETSKAINSTSELTTILQNVVNATLRAIPAADRGSIFFYNEQHELLELMISSYDMPRKAVNALHFKVGEGLVGWVYKKQQAVNCKDAQADRRYKHIEHSLVKPHRAMLCTPITGERRIGVICLSNSENTGAFSPADLDLLVGFADQAAIAIENSERISRSCREAEELEFLRKVSLQINAQIDIEQILTVLMESGNQLLGTEMAVIHWRGRNRGEMQNFAAPAELGDLMTPPRSEEGLTAEIMRSGKPVVIPNTARDKRVNPRVRKVGIQSLVGYPLKLHNKVAGTLFLNSRQRQFFDEHKIHLLTLLLPLAAVAIENASVIERLDRHQRLSAALVEVSSKLTARQGLDEQLSALKQFMLKEMRAPMFYLGLYDADEDAIRFVINWQEGADKEPFTISLKEKKEWTISSYVVKKQTPITWFTREEKTEQCLELGINPMIIGTGCQTCLAYPLEIEGQILGVISIQNAQSNAWDSIDVTAFKSLAYQASIALRNVRLDQQIRKVRSTAIQVAQLTVLGNLKDTLASIAEGVKDVLGCDIVTLWTYRQEKDQFDYLPALAGKLKYPAEVGKHSNVDRSAAPYRIIGLDDIYVSEDTLQDEILGSPFSRREDVRSSVGVPLKTHNRRVGVLFINFCGEEHHFSEEELGNIHLFSHQAAAAISNAMSYEEELKRLEVIQIIDEAGRTVTKTLQLDEVLDNLAKQAFKLTGEKGKFASFASIVLVEGTETILKAIYPPTEADAVEHAGVMRIDLVTGVKGRIGIVGRVVKDKAALLLEDVRSHPDYLCSNEDTRGELAVPIIYDEEVIGVINLEHTDVGGLDRDDLQNIRELAAHAAVAIQNARIHRSLERKSRHQSAVYRASKIINASVERSEKELFDVLVEQMVKEIVPIAGAENILGAILTYDADRDELTLVSTCPPEAFGAHRVGESRSLRNPPGGKTGITGKAVLERKPQRVGDVRQVKEYLGYNGKTRSELDVPILDKDTVLGVLSLECDQLNGFDQEAEDALCAFADLAAIAIQNTRRYQQLREAQVKVGNITAVAWMGLVAGAWRHSIGNMTTTISDLSELAQMYLEKGEPPERVKSKLIKIREIVAEVQKIPMPPLSSEDGVQGVYICQLVRDRINQFKQKKTTYGGIEYEVNADVEEGTMVRASPEWLRRILDILIDNARNAMQASEVKKISIAIKPRDNGVEMLFSDTGRGIPDHLIASLFKETVKKSRNEKGSGIGLFLANTVVQTYGGRLEIRASGPKGTTMALWLPVSK